MYATKRKSAHRHRIYHTDPNVDLIVLETNFNLDFYMSDRFKFADNRPKVDLVPIGGHLE